VDATLDGVPFQFVSSQSTRTFGYFRPKSFSRH
jgi:hypothetical protein